TLAHYPPDVVILTNAEPAHLDHFGTAEAYFEAFDTFLARIPASGALVVCLDDPRAAARARRAAAAGLGGAGCRGRAGPRTDRPVVGELGQVSVDDTGARATLMLGGREHGELHVATPGEHMALNALAALLAAREVASDVPVPTEAFLGGLSGFGGVGRRFEAKGTLETGGGSVRVFDDY